MSKANAYQVAGSAVGSAIDASRGRARLQRCRQLLKELDPARPPAGVTVREFDWQCRALRERVHLYSERLDAIRSGRRPSDFALWKAEAAIDLSLQYFRDVLIPVGGDDDDGSRG